ncbi:MAG: coenzyme F420-0:L-glutamate ligase [Propionibacteriales bacterium]|nr:coenzyme F420-0:L-glutamate ligase [Propionibacteriales bacterium]
MSRLEVFAPDGVGEIGEGTDLAHVCAPHVADGDVVVITSKVVSKAEGRVVAGDRETAIRAETVRLVARRGPTRIVENHLGLVMAAAGIDASNVAPGMLVLLPLDPDASARRIRAELLRSTGNNVAVLVSDTAGRAWRHGQTDIAIGAAGIEPMVSFEGRSDAYGNELAVTAPAVADEIAGIAEVVSGKLGGRPVTIVRGLADRVLGAGLDGPGARSLVREIGTDMFGLGSREAVATALAGTERSAFGAPASEADLEAALLECGFPVTRGPGGPWVAISPTDVRLQTLLFAYGWQARPDPGSGARRSPGVDPVTSLAPLS